MIIGNIKCQKCGHVFNFEKEFIVDFDEDFEKQYSMSDYREKFILRKYVIQNGKYKENTNANDCVYCPECNNDIDFSIDIVTTQWGKE